MIRIIFTHFSSNIRQIGRKAQNRGNILPKNLSTNIWLRYQLWDFSIEIRNTKLLDLVSLGIAYIHEIIFYSCTRKNMFSNLASSLTKGYQEQNWVYRQGFIGFHL